MMERGRYFKTKADGVNTAEEFIRILSESPYKEHRALAEMLTAKLKEKE